MVLLQDLLDQEVEVQEAAVTLGVLEVLILTEETQTLAEERVIRLGVVEATDTLPMSSRS